MMTFNPIAALKFSGAKHTSERLRAFDMWTNPQAFLLKAPQPNFTSNTKRSGVPGATPGAGQRLRVLA